MIYGKLVKLRPVEREDLPKTTGFLNDPEVSIPLGAKYFGISLKTEENWYRGYLKGDYHFTSLVIENLKTGEHMGHIGFNEVSWKDRKATVGLFLGKEYWGKGYGTDALMSMCHYGFTQLNFQRIQLQVFAFNRRAIRCYEKCGFIVEVVEKNANYINGEYVDNIVMGVLVEEFMPIYEKYIRGE
ncbi:hypothetical protein BBF96_08235 [Anoxybacter fermentans]|uniref:N-acetyltransferase domain-containing protein n=1 Tax=Anoxybacter fermentans TaxID=1323375 RepID=A0A3Q9HQU0_9FIRM|nr:GNAT family protein [Anoxybacter fermentans]AZR73371.1 hypothetical protein BBF96_08235 [Anoxybacter fermentans]